MSKDKYVLKALSISGASGEVIRKYKAPGVFNILSQKDFKDGAVEQLIDNGWITVATDAQIKASEAAEKPAAPAKKVKKDYQADYKALSKEDAPDNWTVAVLQEEIAKLEADAGGKGDTNGGESGSSDDN